MTTACVKCGGTDDLMDRAMAPGMTFCGPCRRAMCPDCTPEPATSPVARCRRCGRSECRHDASHHSPLAYDMFTYTECVTCLGIANRRLDGRAFKGIPPSGYPPIPDGLIDPPTGGSTQTADKQPDDPAHSQSSGSGVHAAKFPAKDDQDAVSRPPVAPAPLPE